MSPWLLLRTAAENAKESLTVKSKLTLKWAREGLSGLRE
jgi:hypothetical protein